MTTKKPLPKDLPFLQTLWHRAFGDPAEFTDIFFRKGYSPDRCRILYQDDLPVTVAYWFDCLWEDEKCAYLYGIATAPEHRGKGFCRNLLEQLHQELTSLGYAGAVLVPAGESLFSLYGKLGYSSFCPMEKLTVLPGKAIAVKQAPADSYDFAPTGSVRHTKNALNFLTSYCKLYEGKCFRFWGAVENTTLYIQEFVGDSAQLPGICAGLGAEKAVCRIYGSGPDYAMYLPLGNNNFRPRYFGIPLD